MYKRQVNIPSGCMLQTAIADLSPAVDVDANEFVQLPLPFEAARFEEGVKVDEAVVMEWAKKNGAADGWGPRGLPWLTLCDPGTRACWRTDQWVWS